MNTSTEFYLIMACTRALSVASCCIQFNVPHVPAAMIKMKQAQHKHYMLASMLSAALAILKFWISLGSRLFWRPLLRYKYVTMFCIDSKIPSGGVDTTYIGSSDGESKISCMAFLNREDNEGDFFYLGGASFNITALKAFTLSEVETDIQLSDGSWSKLGQDICIAG